MQSSPLIEQYRQNFDILLQLSDPDSHIARQDSFEYFQKTGFPTIDQEDWRFTSLAPLSDKIFKPVFRATDNWKRHNDIASYFFKNWHGFQIVFIDGHFNAPLSNMPSNFPGVQFSKFAEAIPVATNGQSKYHSDLMNGNDAFTALNAAFFWDAGSLRVAPNTILEQPIHICFISMTPDEIHMSHPRLQVDIGRNAQVTLVESYQSISENCYLTNALTQIRVDENAQLIHYRLQNESVKAYHISNSFVHQKSNSRYDSVSVNFGGALVRNNLNTFLDGQGIISVLNGLYMARGKQHIDNQTFIDHAQPRCESHELYQGILTDDARGVFSGKILVRQDAQKTDAKQSNNCLLLSDTARINSKPQLEIYADDVKCTHGATVGHLDDEQIFYLMSRGIGKQRAKNILTYAFAERVIDGIRLAPVRDHVDLLLKQRFGDDFKI